MSTKIVVALTLAIGAARLPAAEAGKRVTVTGRAAGTTPAAEEEAKLDALRTAVERVCGAFINAQTDVENFAVVRDKVLEQPVGFARVVKVIKGPTVVGGSLTEVQIEAEVFPAQFEKRWAEFVHILQREGNPRCVIMIVEDDGSGSAGGTPVTGGVVQTEFENFFLGKGVQLMDRNVGDEVRTRDLQLAAINGDLDKAAAVGAAFKADVVVLGRAEAKPGDPVTIGGHTFKRWNVTLSVKAVQTDSAAILVSKTYVPEQRPAGSTSAGRDGLMALAKEAAPKALADVADAWRKRATVGKTIQLVITPCSRKQFKALQAEMIKLKGVTGGEDGFKLRELVNDVASIEVNWKYDLDQLADRIEELSVVSDGQKLSLEVTEQSANRINLRLTTKSAGPTGLPGSTRPSEATE